MYIDIGISIVLKVPPRPALGLCRRSSLISKSRHRTYILVFLMQSTKFIVLDSVLSKCNYNYSRFKHF